MSRLFQWLQRRKIGRLQPVFFLLAFVLISLTLYRQWGLFSAQSWRIHAGWMLLSAGWLLISWGIEVVIWRGLLAMITQSTEGQKKEGVHDLHSLMPYWASVRIWFLSAIMRYIPGNIWQPMSMAIYCQRWQIAPEQVITSVLLYQLINLFGVAPIALSYFAVTGNWGLMSGLMQGDGQWFVAWLLGAAAVPVVCFFAQPNWLILLGNLALRRLGRAELPAQLQRDRLFGLLCLTVFDWLCWGAAFASLTFALSPFSWAEITRLLPHLVAANAIAYAIGFVSLITPSGIGVREGALYLLLAPLLGGGLATIAALAMRLWITLGEIVMAAGSYWVERR